MSADLIVLAADKNTEHGLRGLLNRPRALGIRSINFRIYVHSQHDPGCAVRAHDFLRQFADDYRHGLVVFDREGSGREHIPVDQLQNEIRQRMAVSGWDDRAEVVVLDPELEVWVFAGSPDVERCLGWRRRRGLRNWLQQQGLWEQDHAKPARPKEALETALRAARRSRSSMYECLGSKVGVAGCIDPAFHRLRQTLMEWFPPNTHP